MPCDNHGIKCDGMECFNKNLDNGLMTRIWGPSGWLFLHCITFGYPYKIDPNNKEHLEKQNDYYKFFYYLGKVLPCKYCRISYMDFFTENSIMHALETRKDLTKWLYDIHNLVNNKLGVPQCEQPSFEDIETQYQSYRASCKPLTTKERTDNAGKGCIAPADGKPKRSVIKVVEYASSTGTDTKKNIANSHIITQQPNTGNTTSASSALIFPKAGDYIIINKHDAMQVIKIIIIICIIIISYMAYKQLFNNKTIKQ